MQHIIPFLVRAVLALQCAMDSVHQIFLLEVFCANLRLSLHRARSQLTSITHSCSQCTLYTVLDSSTYTEYSAYAHMASGLSVGLSALGAGMAIGIVGDAGVRANGQQPKLFVGMILILIFAEALGLYGLIVAIVLSQK